MHGQRALHLTRYAPCAVGRVVGADHHRRSADCVSFYPQPALPAVRLESVPVHGDLRRGRHGVLRCGASATGRLMGGGVHDGVLDCLPPLSGSSLVACVRALEKLQYFQYAASRVEGRHFARS